MLISNIIEIDKKRRKVFIDGEEAFTLFNNELYRYHLEPDTILSEEVYDEIMAVLNKRAKLKVMDYLKQSDKSEHELRTKLKRLYFPDPCIDVAIEYVRGYHYIDDNRYAENYIRYKSHNKSKQAIAFELKKKGVSTSIIQDCMEEVYTVDAENDAIRKQILKKYSIISTIEPEQKQKLIASLCRKGFSYERIKQVISTIEEEQEDC